MQPKAGTAASKNHQHTIRGPGGTIVLAQGDRAARDLLMLVAGETSGRPLADVLAEYGRSRSAYYDKLRRFRAQGLGGLLPRRSGPREPWRRTLEVVRRIVRARLREPGAGAAAIAEELRREGVAIGLRSVERTLAEFGLTAAAPCGRRAP